MDIHWDINRISTFSHTAITMGTFDGIHLGHQKILNRVIESAKSMNGQSTLITFEPHPQLILKKKQTNPVYLLTLVEEKIDILTRMGMDQLIIANFTKDFANTEPTDFISRFLVEKLHAKKIIIGHDHAFGKDKKGNYQLLQLFSQKYDFSVETVNPVRQDDTIVSSTLIRKLLLTGQVKQAAQFLGREYIINGNVIKGNGRGKDLGFPTANIRPFSSHKLIPKPGIYATRIKVDKKWYDSVTYIGTRPTFHLMDKVIEVHIFDFDQTIYHHDITIRLLEFMRGDQDFKTSAGLIDQIKKDIKKSKELLKNINS